ncbi:MAG TPA: alpha/beta hydrolase [Firmicutes bacterium]|jgi:alpha-beta hydrolase superfamily lysophospholipase|nr:alpha/beta hydrolase [Bacillota bacterium]
MKLIFKDSSFSFELLRAIGHTAYGGADINECLGTAYRIKEGDFKGWYREWYQTADRVATIASRCLAEGHMESAREAYLRASNYYRTAEFYLHEGKNTEEAMEAWQQSRDCFRKAGRIFEPQIEIIKIPYEGTTLPGYFLRVAEDEKPRPTLIVMTGFDGTAEELYFEVGLAALRRGYHVLIFEGPGQGGALREQNLYFRPDWEKVVTPVVDYLVTKPEVDPAHIALIGYSFGGYLAPRAAAFEHRLAACVANGGIYNFFDGAVLKNKPAHPRMLQELKKDKSPIMDWGTRLIMHFNTEMRWAVQDGLWKFNVATPHQLLQKFQECALEGIVEQIHCPTLVCDSEGEQFFGKQAEILYQKLTCPKEYILFTKKENAETHCQSGAHTRSNQRILDWLDRTLKR